MDGAESRASDRRRGRTLVLLFFLSGISGLVYEVVWLRMLIRAFGVTIYAVSTVLVVFMTGLAIGSIAVGRYVARRKCSAAAAAFGARALLRYYALAELSIGLSALASTLVIVRLPAVFQGAISWLGAAPYLVALLRFALAVLVLMVPTFLMGATLPLLSGHLAASRGGGAEHAGLLYGANTLGAVLGVLAAGFVLLYLTGELATVFIAVGINLAVGILALLLVQMTEPAPALNEPERAASDGRRAIHRTIVLLYAVSGFSALAYQVIWSRILNLLLGNSVYAFSSMVGAYLIGIGAGSLLMARYGLKIRRPIMVFAIAEVLVTFLAIGSLHVIRAIGFAHNSPDYLYSQIWTLGDFGRLALTAAAVVLPVTLVLGAIFPLATLLARDPTESVETSVGRLYGFNTVGAIFGSFLTGFVFIPLLGTTISFLIVSFITFLVGVGLFRLSRASGEISANRPVIMPLLLALCFASAYSLEDPFQAILAKRLLPAERVIAHQEGGAATVTATEDPETKHLFINGLYVSSTDRLSGNVMVHIPLLLQSAPERALLIGLGVGEAFKSALDHGVDVTVVDLIPQVSELFKIFQPTWQRYLENPRGRIATNDGRNYLLGTNEKFDLILVDGTPPVFASGMVNLYSFEFIEMVKRHLTREGVFTLYFPTTCFEEDFWMIARNFADVFPRIGFWTDAGMSGILIFGSSAAQPIFEPDPAVLAARLARVKDIQPPFSVDYLLHGLFPDEPGARRQAARFPRVTDDHPYTEFPLFNFWKGVPYLRTNEFFRHFKAPPG